MRARMAMTRMLMRRKKYCKPMIDHRGMCRTQCLEGLTWQPLISTEMIVRMETLWIRMRHEKDRSAMMHHHRMSFSERIVLDTVKI
jgi:hypothetical protein